MLLPFWEYVFVLCVAVRYLLSILVFAIILMGKRELVACLSLSSWFLMTVVWLLLAVTWVCLLFASVVNPDHTHLLFYIYLHYYINMSNSYKEVFTFLNRDVAFSPKINILT